MVILKSVSNIASSFDAEEIAYLKQTLLKAIGYAAQERDTATQANLRAFTDV